jgi:serine/threonine protein kinase
VREGASIGPYRVVRKIGEGGMGTVFLGEHTLIGRHAAIKVLLPELSSKRESVDRFFNEARATTAISDPGIVQVFDFGFTADKTAYIVMELLEGEQLNLRLGRLGALAPADALRITRQVAGSLGAAHAAGIVHRDLKPENLYMIRDPEAPGGERPKILDFGIAKLGEGVPDRLRTRTGAVMGTPVYMSPEQCNGAGRIDHRADIYSLGCVLFHLLTGRPPFDLPGIGAIISAHLREPAPAPSSLVPLPAEIDELVLRCLAKPPDERFATMLEVQHACDAILARISASGAPNLAMPFASMPTVVPRTLNDAPRTTLSTSAGQPSVALLRRRLGLWLVAAALAGGAGSAIAFFTSRSSERELPAGPGLRAVASPDAPPHSGPIDAGAAPVAPVAVAPPASPSSPIDAGAAPAAAVAPAPSDASTLPVAEPAAPPRATPPSRPAVGKPPVKAKPPRPRSQDLYDDRN